MTSRSALGILVCVQLVLAAITWWPDGAAGPPTPLLPFASEEITGIEIASKPAVGAEPDPVVLARKDGVWVVASAADYPARPEKIEELLGLLLGLEAETAVATNAASHNAMKVGEEEYGRRIEVTAGGERVAFRVGAATSKTLNLRREDEDTVYRSAGASEWSFADRASAYYDPLYVSVPPEDLTAVTVANEHGEITFVREGETFTLGDLSEGEVADADAIQRFLATATKLRMTKPVGQEVEPAHGFEVDAGGARMDWTVAAEDQSLAGGYWIGSEVESDRYAKALDSRFVVRVLGSSTARVRAAERSEFLGAAPAAE